MYQKVNACRICGNAGLEPVLDLGEQMLTGVFPGSRDQTVTTGPLRLVKCVGSDECCGLLQLAHSYDLSEMYGDNYGYRSGLNASMVAHLGKKVERIERAVTLNAGDLIIDIGSNDSTTLQAYGDRGLTLVGVDPTGTKFRDYYPAYVDLIPDFFSADLVQARFPGRKAKVVTSFSMFYDLEAPMEFMRQVADVLADDGIWVFEQSYMPLMLDTNSYDTVCHEHLEFYALRQIEWMARRTGLHILDVEFNDVNGGSFSITVRKTRGDEPLEPAVNEILTRERAAGLDTVAPFHAFAERTAQTREELIAFLRQAKSENKVVGAIGASTKGNVLLQYCDITTDEVVAVGEVNAEKFGKYTPGTFLPIVSESDLLAQKPDYLIVLPWHFRRFFETSAAFKGQTLVFPLPQLETVTVK
ncbi:class I SAM-dependent methyltransferase [Sphingomonas sp. CD22]|uniref:class I SAM-dependent methyltransferase n=1 Tax=Sphingomonas sp. CD22 TaxID=3100214 RepID=UPI002AE07D42|nr:class I SAM-dependent methyltransferase [Sphingomonas sp. CD22]MEA1085865.1 class I SAM-dependent methyltransferase [Sphingomonas sp. CD22]